MVRDPGSQPGVTAVVRHDAEAVASIGLEKIHGLDDQHGVRAFCRLWSGTSGYAATRESTMPPSSQLCAGVFSRQRCDAL